MHVSFSAVNENADENEIPFSAEKRKRKSSPVPISQISRKETGVVLLASAPGSASVVVSTLHIGLTYMPV